MSAKRTAPYQIDEKTLEPIENPQPASATQPHEQRQIHFIKKDDSQPKKDLNKPDQSKPLLFGNMFNNNNGVGLFSSIGLFGSSSLFGSASSNPPKIDLKSPNLFSGNGAEKPQVGSFFKSETKNDSIFKQGNASIFGFQEGNKIPPVKAGDQQGEGGEGDSAELEKAQTMEIDRSKSKGKFEYQQQMVSLLSGVARKFKKGNGDLVESVQVTLQHDPKSQLNFIVVKLMATKNTIFSGIVLANKSEVRVLNHKEENLQVSVFVMHKNDPAQRIKIKLQLETAEVGKLFVQKLNQIIENKTGAKAEDKKNSQQNDSGNSIVGTEAKKQQNDKQQ